MAGDTLWPLPVSREKRAFSAKMQMIPAPMGIVLALAAPISDHANSIGGITAGQNPMEGM